MLISVEEALAIVINERLDLGSQWVELHQSLGRTLLTSVATSRDYPPFDRVMMDGICIQYEHYAKGQRTFIVDGIIGAGQNKKHLENSDRCFEIMTGASLPVGSDTVVRYEDLSPSEGGFTIVSKVVKGQNVHKLGMDVEKGSLLLEANTRIGLAEIGVLASEGFAKVEVARQPKIAIVSTGDELVNLEDDPQPHQIRKSNVHMIFTDLVSQGIDSALFHFSDQEDDIEKQLSGILTNFDVVILSGGVSKGKYDFIPGALTKLGVKMLFHGVGQRPGKPFWFGRNENTLVFALPGNPVSTLVCYLNYVKVWLSKNSGLEFTLMKFALAEDIEFAPDVTFFAPCILEEKEGIWKARITKGNGSGDFAALVGIDGFLILPRGRSVFRSGEVYSYLPLKS